MSLYRITCKFLGCAFGDDGGAYKTREDLDSEELAFMDMKLHMGTQHVGTGHNVDNGKEWLRQQVEPNPLVEGLQIMVDKPSYKKFGIPAPVKVYSIVGYGFANSKVDKMYISPGLAMGLRVRRHEMFPVDLEIVVVCGTPMKVLGGS